MLVLTRKPDEEIVIGDHDEITITILRIQGDKVSIGIRADKNAFPVYRKELLEQEKGVQIEVCAQSES
jgi:carbon storage regulator CsrA